MKTCDNCGITKLSTMHYRNGLVMCDPCLFGRYAKDWELVTGAPSEDIANASLEELQAMAMRWKQQNCVLKDAIRSIRVTLKDFAEEES